MHDPPSKDPFQPEREPASGVVPGRPDAPERPEDWEALVRAGSEAWRAFTSQRQGGFHRFIPADPHDAWDVLAQLRGEADSFLELGAGVGLITILADRLGYAAYGIECEPELIESARDLADEWGSEATFVEGSFVPLEAREDVSLLDSEFLTITDGADAYAELGLDLDDFDVVYGYPWPGEEDWMLDFVRRCARPGAVFLTYSVTDGFVRHALN